MDDCKIGDALFQSFQVMEGLVIQGIQNQVILLFYMSAQVLSTQMRGSSVAYVSGAHRLDFVKKPLVATMSEVPLHLAPPVQQISQQNFQPSVEEEVIETGIKSVEIQTDYRESQCQTDPYSPQQIYREGQKPQVLTLKHLTYGSGLPATIDVLDSIQLNRQRTWFQNALPPISDQASFNMRRKLMEDQQVRQWSKKQQEIKKVHRQGLELVKRAIIEREEDVLEKNAQRIEDIKIRKTQQKNRLIAKIQRKKIKLLRKLLKSRKVQGEDDTVRDIIEDYANYGSNVYAGISRQGLTLDKLANKYEVQPVALNNYNGLAQIEIPQEKSYKIEDKQSRLSIAHKKALEIAQNNIDKQLKPQKRQDQVVNNEIEALRNVIARPSTPNWRHDQNMNLIQGKPGLSKNQITAESNTTKTQIKREVAILFLQRILRGRAQQNIMYQGKQKRLALIEQLLIVAKIPNLPQNEAEEILIREHQERFRNAMYQGLQGEIIAETLDELSKKLVRISQQKKIKEKVQEAQTERRNRQIQEAGRRNAQNIIKQRQQCLYEEIVKMNQGTIDTYLNEIINDTVERASDRQASIMANLRKQEMNQHLQSFERRYNNNQTLIKDLVQSFLLPNVQRSRLAKKVQLQQRRFQEAAKKSLHTTFTKTASKIMQEKQ